MSRGASASTAFAPEGDEDGSRVHTVLPRAAPVVVRFVVDGRRDPVATIGAEAAEAAPEGPDAGSGPVVVRSGRFAGDETRSIDMSDGGLTRRRADGAGSAGKRTVLVTVTYLEMRSPDRRSAVRGWPERVTVQRAERPTVSFYRYLYDTVGADWDWYERRRLSDDALAGIVHDDAVEVHVLYVRGTPAGYAELDRRVEGEVEIAYFGLVPDYIGRGLGPALLDWALERAWSYRPRRVWLHTCSLDHPKALAVYRRAGFEVYDREIVSAEIGFRDPARRGRSAEDARTRAER